MAENERQLLTQAINQVQIYDEDARSPYSLEHFLMKLNDADQSSNEDLWKKLRTALAESRQVSRKATKKFLDRSYFAEEGYWWWDPSEWEVESVKSKV